MERSRLVARVRSHRTGYECYVRPALRGCLGGELSESRAERADTAAFLMSDNWLTEMNGKMGEVIYMGDDIMTVSCAARPHLPTH